jgi:hypothetical protein
LVTVAISCLAAVGLARRAEPADSTAATPSNRRFVFWTETAALRGAERAVDVTFAHPNLNIVQPMEVAWVVDAAAQDVAAIATKPIQDTAEAGETMGRFGNGILRRPIAIAATETSRYVLEASGRLVVRRPTHAPPPALATRFDSLALGLGRDQPLDLTVSSLGLIGVLAGNTVRIYTDPPAGAALYSFTVEPAVRPATALAVNMRGEIFVAGGGRDAIAVYDLDRSGKYRRVRSVTARALGVTALGGIAVSPMLLLPVDRREGWVQEDRFVVVSEPATGTLIALEAADLKPLARIDVRAEQPEASPGRLDVSNRGQIAYVDARSGAAVALPAPSFAALVQPAKIRWRAVDPDSTARILGGESR